MSLDLYIISPKPVVNMELAFISVRMDEMLN